MADRAVSDDPRVQRLLDRLFALTGGQDRLGRARLRRLLDKLDRPERRLPPVIHVAGTNGKGSVIAYLRAALTAAGKSLHIYTSPHLVRLNERIRIANRLIDDVALADLLEEVIDAVGDDETTFFEATTAAAFLAFSRTPADCCIIEVGIGGRLDATNVVPDAIACAIAQIGIDHQDFLGETIEEIAFEKAGIAKPGTPLVTLRYGTSLNAQVIASADAVQAPLVQQGDAWDARLEGGRLRYRDEAGALDLPAPALLGAHQADNAGLAVAVLRHQRAFAVDEKAIASGLATAHWPARLAQLAPGPLTSLVPSAATVLLDGAHNVPAMQAVVAHLRETLPQDQWLEVVFALLRDKDAHGVLRCFAGMDCRIRTVPIEGYDSRDPDELAEIARGLGLEATPEASFTAALTAIGRERGEGEPFTALIAGSLYLAGKVLAANDEVPD